MGIHVIEQKVIENIYKYKLINKGDLVVVGFSGGCDSTSLLNIFLNISKIVDTQLIAVHVNHMIRGTEATRDEKFCADFCLKNKIDLCCFMVNVPEISKVSGKSTEEIGREERYRIFNEAGLKYSARSSNVSNSSNENNCNYKIAVAHNREDLAETVVLNLIRGTSIDGLKGIDFKRDNIIRPLLSITREDLEKYCKDKNLQYIEDSTNTETLYKRNKIRHNVMPVLANTAEGNLSERIYNMSRLIVDDTEFLTLCAENEYAKCLIKNENEMKNTNRKNNINNKSAYNKEISIKVKYFNTLHKALRRRIIRLLIKNIYGSVQGIESTHINDIVDLAQKSKTGKYLCLPGMIRVRTDYDSLTVWVEDNNLSSDSQLLKAEKNKHFSVKINIPGETEVILDGYNLPDPLALKGSKVFKNSKVSQKQTKLIIKAKLIDQNIDGADDTLLSKYNRQANIQIFDFNITGEELFLRNRQEGDIITPYKFIGTKKLKKYFIDEKVPAKLRYQIPLIARDSEILWVLGNTINQKYICTSKTKNIIELEIIKRGIKI